MPDHSDLVYVARALKARLNCHAFLTVKRYDITKILRGRPGNKNTRLKSAMSEELEKVLLEHGLGCFPSLKATPTHGKTRVFHTGTVVASLVEILSHPSPLTDRELADITKKVKGEWDWPADDAA